MEAPKPVSSFSFIKKELVSEQGNKCTLQISYTNDKFVFIIEKNGKIFKDKFKNEYNLSQIQENKYFKMFDEPQEIIEELNQKIELKTPIVTESEAKTINLIIFLQNSKYKQAEFKLNKESLESINQLEDFKSIIEKLYESYEELKMENTKIKSQNEQILKRLEELENIKTSLPSVVLKKNNFHWINEEVIIVDNSKFTQGRPPDIMLNKQKNEVYSLTEGNRNHFVEFSFNNIYFLKAIRISVDNYECSLKTFKIEIITPNEQRINCGTFTRSSYKDNSGFEEFQINQVCKGIKLYLIDNWGSGGGNYILIKRIDFNVSD